MSVLFWAVLAISGLALFALIWLGIALWFYARALEECHREGWDMPN
jgi:hypothetical protein